MSNMQSSTKNASPAPSTTSVEPSLTIGDVLEKTWALYRSLLRPLVLVQLVMVIPSILLSVISGGLGILWLFSGGGYFLPDPGTTPVVQTGLGVLISVVIAALSLCLSAWQQAALILVIREKAPLGVTVKKAARFIPQMLVVMVLAGILIMLGFFVFLIPGIFLAVALSLSTILPISEGLSGTDALKRSYAYIRGSWWKVFSVGIVFLLLLIVVSTVLSIPVSGIENQVAPTVYSGIVSLLLAPLGVCFTYVVYTALRAKQQKGPSSTSFKKKAPPVGGGEELVERDADIDVHRRATLIIERRSDFSDERPPWQGLAPL